MLRSKTLGRTLIIIGVAYLFRRVVWFNGFGGYVDNSIEIIAISSVLMLSGIMILSFRGKEA